MTDLTIKGILALIIVVGAIASLFFNKLAGEILIPIATLVIGYYFKDSKTDLMIRSRLKKLGRRK